LGSSKGLVFLGVMTAGMVLILTGRLDAEAVYEKIIHLAMVFFPAVAIEDAAKNIAQRPVTPGVQQNVNMPPTVPPPPMTGVPPINIAPLNIETKEDDHG
jgi:hypothetical protein